MQRIILALILVLAGVSAQTPFAFRSGYESASPTGSVRTLVVCDFGSGPKLHALGYLTGASGTGILQVFDGTNWGAPQPPSSPTTSLTALAGCAFDPGGGTRLAIGTNGGLRLFDGSTFSTPVPNATGVALMTRWPGTGGDEIVMAGGWAWIGGIYSPRLARWNGSTFSGMSLPFPLITSQDPITVVRTLDDGTGPKLFLGATTTPYAWSWDGTTWQALPGLSDAPSDFAIWNDGSGPSLVSCGPHSLGCARWDGSAWVALGNGAPDGRRMLTTGSGRLLVTTEDAWGIRELVNGTWVGLGTGSVSGAPPVLRDLAELPGPGAIPVACGDVQPLAGAAGGVAQLIGPDWRPLPDRPSRAAIGAVWDLVAFEAQGARHLYSAGSYGVWRLEGDSWTRALQTASGRADDLEVFDDGTGPALYAATVDPPEVHRFDGTTWTTIPLPPGVVVRRLRTLDDGTGPRLYAAGSFDVPSMTGTSTANYANAWRLDGGMFVPLGIGLWQFDPARDVAVHDDGSGPALYIAGDNLLRLDAGTWTSVPIPGVGFGDNVGPRLLSTPDGSLWCAPGYYPNVSLVRLNGGSLQATPVPIRIDDLQALDAGSGVELALLIGQAEIARRGLGPNDPITSVATVGASGYAWGLSVVEDDLAGPSLFVRGRFPSFGGVPSVDIAEGTRRRPTLALAAGPAGVTVQVQASPSGTEVFNIFSTEVPGTPGSGPWAGLFATNPTGLITQLLVPLGTAPFHVAAAPGVQSFGPYAVPSGISVDGVSIEAQSDGLGLSFVRRIITQ